MKTLSASSPVQDRVVEDLSRRIFDGRLKAGSKLPPTRELAESYGVAVQTAHQAMRALVRRGLVERSRGRGSFVSAQRGGVRTRSVGLIASINKKANGDVLPLFVREMTRRDVELWTLDDCEAAAHELQDLPGVDRLLEARPGVVVTLSAGIADAAMSLLPDAQVVSLDPSPTLTLTHTVNVSGIDCGRLAAACLLASGAPQLYFAGVEMVEGSHRFLLHGDRVRLDSCRWQLENRGRRCQEFRLPVSVDMEALAARLRELPKPAVIFCPMPHRAVELAKAAQRAGLRLPQDLMLIAGADSDAVEALDLTALDVDIAAQAASCADLVCDLLKRPPRPGQIVQIRVRPRVIVRQSCPGPA